MTITVADIKLMQSERLTDNTAGGGRMSGTEVVDGVSNNLFADISSLDRVYGRVSLRKCFAAVLTNDTDTLLGTHAIIDALPADTNVSVVMFQTGSHVDERQDAADAASPPASTTLQSVLLGYLLQAASHSGAVAIPAGATTVDIYIGDSVAWTYPIGINYEFRGWQWNNVTGQYNSVSFLVQVDSVAYVGTIYRLTLHDPWPIDTSYEVQSNGTTTPNAGNIYFNYGTATAAESVPAFRGASPLHTTVNSGNSIVVETVKSRLAPYYDNAEPAIIWLAPAGVPPDGYVQIFNPGDTVVIHHTADYTMATPLSAGQVVSLPRTNLASVILRDQTGAIVATAKYTVNLAAGTVTMATPLDLSGYTQPLIARHRVEDMLLVTAVNTTTKTLTTAGSITHTFPATDSIVSSAVLIGDMKARAANVFDQQPWTNVWADALIGNAASSTYNDVTYPITITNRGSIKERWAIVFTSATAFKVIGETVGEIALCTTGTECAPVTPATGVPYITIPALGWGAGWSANNVVRFNTEGANSPIWIARCVIQGDPSATTDQFTVQIRGDVNA